MEKDTLKSNNPFAIILLSVLTPGLGQVYCGLNRRAGVLYGVGLGVSVLFFLVLYRWFYGFVFYMGFVPAFYLFCMGDAVRFAFSQGAGSLTRFNRWYVYMGIILVHLGMVIPVMVLVVSPIKLYRVPTTSMVPALVPGDYFLVDKGSFSNHIPERGDVVVFLLPGSKDRIYVKRIVGLPGDELSIKADVLSINQENMNESYVNKSGNPSAQNNRWNTFGPGAVPESSFFMLGDNRNHSSDSRQYGAVDKKLLKGTALYLVWAREKKRIGRQL